MRKQRSRVRAAWNAAGRMLRTFGKRARRFGAFALPIAFSWFIAATTMLLAIWSAPSPAG